MNVFFLPYSYNRSFCGLETTETSFLLKLQVVERHVQPSGSNRDRKCHRHEDIGEWMNTQHYLSFINSLYPLRNAKLTRVLVSIYLCLGRVFICDLNNSAGEHLDVLQRCVCVSVYVRFYARGRANKIFMVGLAAEPRAGWQGRAGHRVFRSSSLPLSPPLSV